MVTKRKTAKRSGETETSRLTSSDGRLAFALSRASRGVYVERMEAHGASGVITHGMLVRKAGDFERFLQTDNCRFEQPALYYLVQRQVEEMLDASP